LPQALGIGLACLVPNVPMLVKYIFDWQGACRDNRINIKTDPHDRIKK